MTDVAEPIANISAHFPVLNEFLKTYGPAALQELREHSYQAFNLVGLPSTRDEEFRYLPLHTLKEGSFKPAYGATITREEIGKVPLGLEDAVTVTFVNGEHAPELSSIQVIPEDVFVGTLKEGFEFWESEIVAKAGQIANLEGKLGSTNDERFTKLNAAHLSEGALIRIGNNVAFERPIHIQWVFRANYGPLASHPRTLVILGDNSQANIVETFVGLGGEYFTNAVSEIEVGRDSVLEHTKVQIETEQAIHVANVWFRQGANSTVTSNNVNFGGQTVRNDVNVQLDGEHTETWLNGVSIGMRSQVVDNHTRIDHAKPHCHSFETYKSILDDKATGVFNGKIFVYEDAQKTDAKQTNQAILLGGEATMNTKPQLEIFADDVKCTHGATVGQLREEALFYLQSRGIPTSEARALLVYAFAAEALEKISLTGLKESLEKMVLELLNPQNRKEAAARR